MFGVSCLHVWGLFFGSRIEFLLTGYLFHHGIRGPFCLFPVPTSTICLTICVQPLRVPDFFDVLLVDRVEVILFLRELHLHNVYRVVVRLEMYVIFALAVRVLTVTSLK